MVRGAKLPQIVDRFATPAKSPSPTHRTARQPTPALPQALRAMDKARSDSWQIPALRARSRRARQARQRSSRRSSRCAPDRSPRAPLLPRAILAQACDSCTHPPVLDRHPVRLADDACTPRRRRSRCPLSQAVQPKQHSCARPLPARSGLLPVRVDSTRSRGRSRRPQAIANLRSHPAVAAAGRGERRPRQCRFRHRGRHRSRCHRDLKSRLAGALWCCCLVETNRPELSSIGRFGRPSVTRMRQRDQSEPVAEQGPADHGQADCQEHGPCPTHEHQTFRRVDFGQAE